MHETSPEEDEFSTFWAGVWRFRLDAIEYDPRASLRVAGTLLYTGRQPVKVEWGRLTAFLTSLRIVPVGEDLVYRLQLDPDIRFKLEEVVREVVPGESLRVSNGDSYKDEFGPMYWVVREEPDDLKAPTQTVVKEIPEGQYAVSAFLRITPCLGDERRPDCFPEREVRVMSHSIAWLTIGNRNEPIPPLSRPAQPEGASATSQRSCD